ncbi:acyl-[acyl-carrier-protein] thioesterase [Persicobacter diffluens]|uniref:Acyl-ACP thioesterase n=1 Tax=Persicobacter diffluens TaxID=981 RepID=A0AAN5AM84_9BACT|nr:acyl-ACP thioesterase [Persicobacter diffluens]
MKEIEGIWQQDFHIRAYQCDPYGFARPIVLADMLQDAAGNHAIHRGFGFHDMLAKGQLWVLSRMEIEFLKFPKWREHVRVKSWVKNYQRSFSHRDFEIFNDNGECIVKATTLWVIIDHQTRRPGLIGDTADRMPAFPEKHGIEQSPQRVPKVEVEQPFQFHVRYGDIDLNNHVNNTRYLQWAIDNLDKSIWQNHQISKLTVNYLAETKLENQVSVHSVGQKSEDNFIAHSTIINNSLGKSCCQVETCWKPFKKELVSTL